MCGMAGDSDKAEALHETSKAKPGGTATDVNTLSSLQNSNQAPTIHPTPTRPLVNTAAMIELILLVFRALQLLFAIIVLGLTGHLVSYVFYSPSQVNFMLFNAVWTIVVLIYLGLAPRFFSRYAHVHAITALDALTMLFWFAGFIALAVFYHDFVEVANYEYSAGCAVTGDYCGVTEAAVVFGAFEWGLFLSTTILAAMDSTRSRGKHDTQPSVAPGATA